MAITPRGMEPANLKKRLDTLFPKLNEAYPDKVIRSLARDHKKWAETVTELYRALGYPDSESFLKAYGYIVERVSQGRPAGDTMALIEELKKRYPNGASFAKVGELQDANPDLAGKFKTLANKSKVLFGMSLADYLKSIGLLGGSDHKKQLDELIDELKHRYPADSALPATLAQLKKAPRRIPNPTLWNTENTVSFVPDSRFNQFALKIDDRMEIANAVFRGLHTDVTAAIQSLGIYVKKARISDDISEFVIGGKELVMQVMQEFPNLKVAMFVEFFHTSQIYMAYSRSGYPYITDSYYAGDCDLHEEMRWDWKHLPTEKSFRASSLFINTGMRKSVSYCFRYHKDWEAMNYIVLINGSLRQIKEPKPEAKPEFLIDRIGNDCGIIVEYNGKVKDLVWPETYNGLTIVGINLRNVSKQLMAIQTLVLPEGYCEVGGFEKCTNLKKVVLPQTLRKIHRKAFSYCKQLEEVVIHDNVRYIGDKAFEGCSALRKFTLPAQLRGGNGSGFSRSLGAGLFKNSGLCELYVNGLESNPSNSNFLEGNKNCVIYAPFGSLFHSDPAYRMRTVAYPLVPLLRVYNKIAPILPHFMGAESRSDYLQIDHNQNAIKNIRMWLHLEDAGVQGLTDKLSLTVEEDQIVVWGEQWNRLGSIKILKSIRDLLETYGGQIEKFKIEGPLNEKAQKDGRAVCSFDIVLDAPEEKSTLPLTGKTFVVTGELVNFPEPGPYPKRAELRKLIESMGGKLTGSVSSKTTALITNFPDSGTTKIKKANELDVEIITEEEFVRRYLSE